MAKSLEDFTFIVSDCALMFLYPGHLQRPYDNPFVGSYFQDDEQYLKFCINYEHYMGFTPRFGPALLPLDDNPGVPPGSFPVMFLDDIEIHWLHEPNAETVLEKYYRRLERGQGKTPFFIWADAQIRRPHSPEEREAMISRFLSIPAEQRVYLRQDLAPEWQGQSFDNVLVNVGWAQPLRWANQPLVAELTIKHLANLGII